MLDAKHLPKQAKLGIIDMYTSSVHKDKLAHLISYLNNTLDYDTNPYNCVVFLEKLDEIRKTDWKKTFIELHKSINSKNKES